MTRATAMIQTLTPRPVMLAAFAVAFLTLAMIVVRPAGASDGTLMVSSSPDRSGAVPLSGATISGDAFIFLQTADDVQRVVFSLDGVDHQVENTKPYDFAGTESTNAKPWSSSTVTDGTHAIGALASLVGGGEFTVTASFAVANAAVAAAPAAAPATSGSGTLLVSSSPDRSGASALNGATIDGDVYAFLEIGTKVVRVEFSLDGTLYSTEKSNPYDFAGTTSKAANPWSTASVPNGAHTISARALAPGGGATTVAATFRVANVAGSTPTPAATAAPTATPAAGKLLVSKTANREAPSALGAAAIVGDAYVFVTSTSELREVKFYLDGTFVRTEKAGPYDFGSTARDGSARPWNSIGVPDGTHQIEAVVTTAAGASFSLSASFPVDNDPVEDGSSPIGTTSGDPTRTLRVFVSASPDRAEALTIDGDVLAGEVYVFAVPSESPDRVRFFIDPDTQPLPIRTEQVTPYDLGGTRSDGQANPFDVGTLTEGLHTLSVIAEYGTESIATTVTFTVEYPEVVPELAYDLVISSTADRTAAITLDGTQPEDTAYVFVSPAEHVKQAAFYLDDPSRSSADRVDTTAPFDLVGGTESSAQPLDLTALSAGDHSLTVVLTRTDGTTTETSATFGVGGTVLPDGAILIKTSDNAAQITGAHGPGTTFVFESGIHRGVSITPQSGDVFLGSPGATLSGAQVLSGWSAGSGYWYVGGQTSQLTPHGGCKYNDDGTRYDACQYPEQLFVDGESWWQVTSIGQLAAGRWFFDYAADRVYIGANPSGRVVELSTVPTAFDGSASSVTISGLVIEKYANRAQMGAIQGGSSYGWTVSGNELRLNHGVGLRVGNRMRVLNNNVHHNGQLGIGGIGDDILVEGNEIAYNNTAGFLVAWEAGGTKFVLTDRLVVRNNWVHNNDGRGIWTDIDNINVLVVDNLVEYNSWSGIAHEISYAGEFRNNVSRYNGFGKPEWIWGAQILIQNSRDVLVTGNDVTVAATGGGNGITVVNQDRGSGSYGPYVSENVTVTGNTIRHLGVAGRDGANAGCRQGNTFDNNTYIAPAYWFQVRLFEWCGTKNWNEFRQAGQEPNGTAIAS